MAEYDNDDIPTPAEEQGTPLPPVVPVEGRRVSVKFEHTKNIGNYQSSKASAWVEGYVAVDANETEVATAAGSLFSAACAAVFDTLDVPWILDNEGNVRMQEAPVVTVDQAERSVGRELGGEEVPERRNGVRIMNAGKPGVSTDPVPSWLHDQAERLGVTAVWDERNARTGNQPWFKEAVARGSEGKGKDGKPAAFWPPR